MSARLDPSHIMQTATAFWASKVLLTAVELDLFTSLGDGSMTAAELGGALELHPRGTFDFFDALVALSFLERDGDGPDGRYRNTPETAAFLDKNNPM
jgi:DNA-binding IclR family transcriptional regulator